MSINLNLLAAEIEIDATHFLIGLLALILVIYSIQLLL